MKKDTIRKSRITIDNSAQNEKISFSVAIKENNNSEVLELSFLTNKECIYKTSNNKKVLYPPSSIVLELESENLLILTSCLVSSISMPFKNESFLDLGNVFEDGKYSVKMTKLVEAKNVAKIMFDIFQDNEQIISFSLNKTKVILLLFLIKDTFKKIKKPCEFLVENKSYLFRVHKDIKNEFVINKFILRNSEIEILRYITYTLIFDFKYKEKLQNYKKIHRQILAFENKNNEIMIFLKKMNEVDKTIHFSMNSQVLSSLLLSLPDIEIYRGFSNE